MASPTVTLNVWKSPWDLRLANSLTGAKAFAPVNELASLKSHGDFHTFNVTVGDATIALPRVPGVGTDPQSVPEVPKLGAHTDEVLNSLRNT